MWRASSSNRTARPSSVSRLPGGPRGSTPSWKCGREASHSTAWTVVAAKMVALVERGAARDLRDIHSLCTAGYCTVARCWQLWEVRQGLARGNADRSRARAAIMTHLARLAVARPLERIRDTAERESAAALRSWFERELLA